MDRPSRTPPDSSPNPAPAAGTSGPDGSGPRWDFSSLYQATIAPLRRYLARMLRDSSEAEDVAHDAYLRVYNAADRHPPQKPEALLYTVAHRLALNRIKRRRLAPFARDAREPEGAASPGPGVVQQVMARQEWRQLEQAIGRLPAGCRTVLLLRKVDMLSHREIAHRLGIAVSTVEKQHARALRLHRPLLPAESAPTGSTPETKEAQP